MAADDEFPRGLTLTNNSAGGDASVTFPAVPGIAWVITAASLFFQTVGAASISADLTINGTKYGPAAIDNTANTVAEVSFPGDKLAFPPDTAVTVTSDAGVAGIYQTIVATAYPI